MGVEIVTCQWSRVLVRSTDPKKLVYTINMYLWSEETGKGMSFFRKKSTQVISVASTMDLFGWTIKFTCQWQQRQAGRGIGNKKNREKEKRKERQKEKKKQKRLHVTKIRNSSNYTLDVTLNLKRHLPKYSTHFYNKKYICSILLVKGDAR